MASTEATAADFNDPLTGRKRAQDQLEEYLSLLNATLDATEDAILVVDLSGKWVLFNRQFIELWQIPNGIVAAKDDSAALSYVLMQLEDPDGFFNKVRELYAAPEAKSFDSFNFKDGKTIERYSAPHRIGETIVGRVWSFRDISRRVATERQMRRLNADLSATLKAIPDLLFELDDEGTYINCWANNADLLATQKNALLGHTVTEMLPADAAQTVMSALREAEKEGYSFGQQIRLPLAHGHRWFELSTAVKTETDLPVKRYIMLSRDVTERKQMQDQLHQLAFNDHLTKLPNRLLLNDRLRQIIAASKRSRCYGALLFLDLDHFKPLNDTHGHAAGDLLLVEVASRLSGAVRESDTVARLGGDEFVVLLSELHADGSMSTEQASAVAEKIRLALAAPYQLNVEQPGEPDTKVEHHCSASIGVVLFVNHLSSQTDLMKWADEAMYQAKDAGRNTVRFFDQNRQQAHVNAD